MDLNVYGQRATGTWASQPGSMSLFASKARPTAWFQASASMPWGASEDAAICWAMASFICPCASSNSVSLGWRMVPSTCTVSSCNIRPKTASRRRSSCSFWMWALVSARISDASRRSSSSSSGVGPIGPTSAGKPPSRFTRPWRWSSWPSWSSRSSPMPRSFRPEAPVMNGWTKALQKASGGWHAKQAAHAAIGPVQHGGSRLKQHVAAACDGVAVIIQAPDFGHTASPKHSNLSHRWRQHVSAHSSLLLHVFVMAAAPTYSKPSSHVTSSQVSGSQHSCSQPAPKQGRKGSRLNV
mmetsp:Transcript_21521/g.61560  ORF Transcript_21521/g.61560 Transcript_21521/m.61560 type:complete len:296 (+) Transcript_21521:1371-2258(+)